jgi:hypothetical protein
VRGGGGGAAGGGGGWNVSWGFLVLRARRDD